MPSDVEVVRNFYRALNHWLEACFADPDQELASAPGLEEVFDWIEEGAEWNWLFSRDVLAGREQLLQACIEFASTVSSWRIDLEDVTDLGEGRMLVAIRVRAQGVGSGTPIAERVWSVQRIRDGKVYRMDDFRDPDEARRAAESAGAGP